MVYLDNAPNELIELHKNYYDGEYPIFDAKVYFSRFEENLSIEQDTIERMCWQIQSACRSTKGYELLGHTVIDLRMKRAWKSLNKHKINYQHFWSGVQIAYFMWNGTKQLTKKKKESHYDNVIDSIKVLSESLHDIPEYGNINTIAHFDYEEFKIDISKHIDLNKEIVNKYDEKVNLKTEVASDE